MKITSALLSLLFAAAAPAQTTAVVHVVSHTDAATPAAPAAIVDRLLDRVVQREHDLMQRLKDRAPLVETYIQQGTPSEPPGADGAHPDKDHYFLGRLRLGDTIGYDSLIERSDAPVKYGSVIARIRGGTKNQPLTFLPRGFAQMAILDLHNFNRQTYSFEYSGREFLGDVRCLIFDVAPLVRTQPGRFLGRIWVEDRDGSIVRFNGIYVQESPRKGVTPERYFHFDSWRVNAAPGEWVPAEIYVEEAGVAPKSNGAPGIPRFKAQTRFWDYAARPASKLSELTDVLVDAASGVEDKATAADVSPLESQRAWEKEAEDNILDRLQKGGLLAPPGPVDRVLDTVVNNLIVSANLNVDARCRVLLTAPIETFAVGHTIVISRGLIDVLPDEASLAMVLAAELSHIALGHPTPTQFAFHSQTMLGDAELLQRFHFGRTPEELSAAAKKTIEIMHASPYQKTGSAGLFLKALAIHGTELPRLLQANLGNQIANTDALSRLAEFSASAPELDNARLEQIAALPLGSRVKLNPWNNGVELVKTKPIALLSAREKMPFEVTPFAPHLTRFE
jgi:hypothetical protein